MGICLSTSALRGDVEIRTRQRADRIAQQDPAKVADDERAQARLMDEVLAQRSFKTVRAMRHYAFTMRGDPGQTPCAAGVDNRLPRGPLQRVVDKHAARLESQGVPE